MNHRYLCMNLLAVVSAPPHRLHSLELTALHFFLYSPGMLARRTRATIHTSPAPYIRTSHAQPVLSSLTTITHALTRTPENGVWMLGNLNTCRFLPLPGSEAKSSNLMMFYEGKKSMSMISWGRNGTQAN